MMEAGQICLRLSYDRCGFFVNLFDYQTLFLMLADAKLQSLALL